VLQGKLSNYDTDLFQPIIAAAGARAGTTYGANPRGDVSLRILADHARAATFLVHDGVTPDNEGRGYVLRKIVRRALRHARSLGVETAILSDLAGVVADQMTPAYPDLETSRQRVATVLRAEEERFAHTLALALRELDRVVVRHADGRTLAAGSLGTRALGEQVAAAQRPVLAGGDAFRLYDTFGLPLDLLREIASERGLALDEGGFESAMEQQRQRARRSWKGGDQGSAVGVHRDLAAQARTVFEGYNSTVVPAAHLRALLRDGQLVAAAAAGDELDAVLDHTPFYAASGGQIGDQGIWTTPAGLAAEVLDTFAPVAGLTLHRIRARLPLAVGQTLEAEVDVVRRDATRRNHTATHLLHAALRQLLGTHVKQAGSVVEPGRLRFDFTHYAPLTAEQLGEIERVVNTQILQNLPVDTELMPLDQALSTGAMALFGEKYQEHVRVVSVPGFSKELCGGTHTRRTGDIGLFTIAYETSVASGIRRIEALTGEAALSQFQAASQQLHEVATALRVGDAEVLAQIERNRARHKELEDEIERLRLRAAQAQANTGNRLREVAGVRVLTARADQLARPQLRNFLDELRGKNGADVIVLGGVHEGKAALIVAVAPAWAARLPAGNLLKALPEATGGGRAEMAEGGAKDPARLDAILEGAFTAVERLLGQ
ncbi:MAG: alanine--tRNA ligase, partial [Terriglobales bacterium]